jgi:hypothetical protein
MKILWYIYAVIYIVLFLLFDIGLLGGMGGPRLTVVDYLYVLLALPSFVAVAGWAWKKPVGTQLLWRIYVPAFLAYQLFFFINFGSRVNAMPSSTSNSSGSPLDVIIIFLLYGPSLLAMVRYAMKFNSLKSPGAPGPGASPPSAPVAPTPLNQPNVVQPNPDTQPKP